jgi:general stress protein 26
MKDIALTKSYIRDFLSHESLAVVSSVSEEGKPHAATIFFSVNNEFQLFFSTRRDSQKYKNIAANPAVSVVVSNLELMVTVQIEGTATEVTDATELQQFMDTMLKISMERSQMERWMAPVHLLKNGDFVVMKVSPQWMRVGDFRDIQQNPSDYFHELVLP